MKFSRGILVIGALLAVVLLAACSRPYQFTGTPFDPVIAAPEIPGAQSDGTAFDMDELTGKVVLLFFGYTFCPDICPLTLAEMKSVIEQLGDKADNVAVVFVTLDPERDTPDRLSAYLQSFDPAFIGVQTTQAALESIKKDYGVFSEKRVLDASQSAADYLIDHTGWTYLIDHQGDLRAIFSMDATPEQIAADVSYLVDAR
jgi:protein SCO1/2